jgi:hypothetical protein
MNYSSTACQLMCSPSLPYDVSSSTGLLHRVFLLLFVSKTAALFWGSCGDIWLIGCEPIFGGNVATFQMTDNNVCECKAFVTFWELLGWQCGTDLSCFFDADESAVDEGKEEGGERKLLRKKA